jgi:hypothetical protein
MSCRQSSCIWTHPTTSISSNFQEPSESCSVNPASPANRSSQPASRPLGLTRYAARWAGHWQPDRGQGRAPPSPMPRRPVAAARGERWAWWRRRATGDGQLRASSRSKAWRMSWTVDGSLTRLHASAVGLGCGGAGQPTGDKLGRGRVAGWPGPGQIGLTLLGER